MFHKFTHSEDIMYFQVTADIAAQGPLTEYPRGPQSPCGWHNANQFRRGLMIPRANVDIQPDGKGWTIEVLADTETDEGSFGVGQRFYLQPLLLTVSSHAEARQ